MIRHLIPVRRKLHIALTVCTLLIVVGLSARPSMAQDTTEIPQGNEIDLGDMVNAAPLFGSPTLAQNISEERQGDETDLTDTPAAQRLLEWLAVWRSGDTDALRTFIEENYAASALVPVPAEGQAIAATLLHQQVQDFHIHSVVNSTDTSITVLAQSVLTETWTEIIAEVEPESPHKMIALRFRGGIEAPADAVSNEPLTEEQFLDELSSYLNRLMDAGVLSGTVAIAKDGEVVFENAYGLADQERGTPNTVDTLFNIGSMNKMFTSVAIAQLVEQGLIAYHDPISNYLDDFPAEIGDAVTIHNLLTHTSGLAEMFRFRDFLDYVNTTDTVRGYFPLFVDQPLQFQPGERHAYTNSNFVVLGAIIEAVTGESYFDYVREHIFEPAGMEHTDSYLRDEDVDHRAIGYTNVDEMGRLSLTSRENTSLLPAKGSPAGSGYSTASDLLNFAEALLNYELVSEEYTNLILDGKVDTPISGDRYAYGFIERANGSVGHGGGFPGVGAYLNMYRDSGYTVVILMNKNTLMPPELLNIMPDELLDLATGH